MILSLLRPVQAVDRPKGVLRKDLRCSTVDGTAYSIQVGVGETYLPAFVLAAGMGPVPAGLVATLPPLAGAVLQLAAPAMARRLGSYRRWVVACASVQALSFAPLIAMAWTGVVPPWAVFLAATLYWASGLATGPAWSTWIGMIVPRRIRARYFGRRSRICQLGTLGGLAGGGLSLHYGAEAWGLRTFAALFLTAAVCRTVCAVFLHRQSDVGPVPESHRLVRGKELLRRLRHGDDGRFIVYMVCVQVGVQIAGPFFTPFMLDELRFTYLEYLMLVGAAFTAKAACHPMWGAIAHRVGPTRLLWIGGLGIVPLSAFWLMFRSFELLLFTQLAAGALWGAYELGTFLLTFETIREEERASLLATFNLANASAMAAGSLVGAAILKALGGGESAYYAVFALSLLARASTLVLLARTREVTIVPVPLPSRTLAVRPSSGSIDGPVLPGIRGSEILEAAAAEPAPGAGPAALGRPAA